MSRADDLFKENVRDILQNGTPDTDLDVRPRWADTDEPAHTIKKFCLVNRYDLSKEFPILTVRKINFDAAVDEILWIWQKKSNNINDLNSHIWDAWADENGSIGKAYGYQLGKKYKFPEGEMDQVDMVLHSLSHNPASRRIVTNLFNHEELSEMALYPCAYSVTFNVAGGRLNAVLNQRSNDFIVANSWNVVQYSVLVHMFAQCAGLLPGELVHVIADAHIYDRHVAVAEELLTRKTHDAPRLVIDPDIKDFYKFTPESFRLEGYEHEGGVGKLPVAI